MRPKAYIKPTKASLIIGIIVSVFFLIFGIAFFAVLVNEGSLIGQGFMVFWTIMILIMGGTFIHSLINYNKNEKISIAEVVDLPETINKNATEIPFDEKLRKLEELKNEGLISEREYDEKRKEIFNLKW